MRKAFSTSFFLSLIFLTSGVLRAENASPSPADPPKPQLLVSFERQAIKENDAIQVRVWLTNEWNQSLANVTLHVDSPAALRWTDTTCAQREQDWNKVAVVNEFKFGGVGPNTVRSRVLCVQSGPSIDVGDFNILFTADYSWTSNGAERHSMVTSEKQVKANLFGSDNVAGVPIALAAFIVPGLFFWLVLEWLKFPLNIGGLGLGDRVLYSVLTSIPLLWIVNWVKPDQNAGISFSKLGFYALTGLGAGFVIGVGPRLRTLFLNSVAKKEQRLREERERIRKAAEIRLGDSPEVMLGKLLNLYPDYLSPRAELRAPDGKTYRGSLAAETDEVVGIIGWFQIDQTKIDRPNKQAIIAELQAATRSIDRFNIATKYGLKFEGRNPITVDGNEIHDLSFTLPRKDAEAETLNGQGTDEPLVVV